MQVQSFNEWDPLKEIVVGSATGANWPSQDPVFACESQRTSWQQTPVPSGPVPQWLQDEANEDLDVLCSILTQAGVRVHRPRPRDFVATAGMYNYCPRDRLLIAGNQVVDPPMMYPCRDQEIDCLDFVVESNTVITMPRDQGMILDAANVCRLNDTWLFLSSFSGNTAAYQWLTAQFPEVTIELVNFYAGVHIDSTVIPLREGLVLLNGARVNEENCPRVFRNWDKIYCTDVVEQGFHQYPYASKWIALNMLSLDPDTVIMDAAQTDLRHRLENLGITVIPHTLRHSRTLGGGFHCVTLDLVRQTP